MIKPVTFVFVLSEFMLFWVMCVGLENLRSF